MADRIQNFWARACEALGISGVEAPVPWQFGVGKAMGDELAALVCAGAKTATCCLVDPNEAAPQVGELDIVLNGTGDPVAVIKTASVELVPFGEVSAEFAASEGEGDLSLEYWRKAHLRFWAEEEGAQVTADTLIQCERFEVVYSEGVAEPSNQE